MPSFRLPVPDAGLPLPPRRRPTFDGIDGVVTVTAMLVLVSCCAPTALAGAPLQAARDTVPVQRTSQTTAPTPTHAVRELAAALQETTAGGEQMFCAADLAQLPRPHGRSHARAGARLLQARAGNRSAPGGTFAPGVVRE